MNAAQPWWVKPALVAFMIGFVLGLVLLGWGILIFTRWLQRSAERAHQRAFDGLWISSDPRPCDVFVRFHTYYGFIAFVTQTEYSFWASPDDARLALKRLHHSNLTWGFLAYGALLIPLVSYGNYLAQKRSISKQERSRLTA